MSEDLIESPAAWARGVAEQVGEAHFLAQVFDESHPDRDPLECSRIAAQRGGRAARARSRTYRAQLPRTAGGQLPSDAAAVLDQAAAARAALHAAQVAELAAALAWAAMHPAPDPEVQLPGGEQGAEVAGEGAPLVAEFCLAELGLCLGVATETARGLVGDAVELAHRLPTTWARLLEGGVPVYRARRVAQASRALSPSAAAHLDVVVAPLVHVLGTAALDTAVSEAVWRHDLEAALAQLAEGRDRRGVRIELRSRGVLDDGTVPVEACLDRADAVELDATLTHLAHQLLDAGSTESLGVRRAQALGMLARGKAPLPLPRDVARSDPQAEEWDEQAPGAEPVIRRRQVVLHVHLSHLALGGLGMGADPLARLEGHHGPVLAAQVREWLTPAGNTGAHDSIQVVVKPVIDLDAALASPAYQPSGRLAEQIVLRDRTCVFPHCTRAARACDLDHITAYEAGGATSSHNLAPLCRWHHRLKTHHPGWSYRMLHPGTYLWISPQGRRVLRDAVGTHSI